MKRIRTLQMFLLHIALFVPFVGGFCYNISALQTVSMITFVVFGVLSFVMFAENSVKALIRERMAEGEEVMPTLNEYTETAILGVYIVGFAMYDHFIVACLTGVIAYACLNYRALVFKVMREDAGTS